MSQGRSIRLFLVDGSPTGLLTAEIMNWTGHVLSGPRSKLSELVKRAEVARPGVYFLVGPNPENSFKPLVYIGETDDVGKRLQQHNKPEDKGGKDFWEKVCLVTSKDQNLTKGHVKHLESLLILKAKAVGRCELLNGQSVDYASLPEADLADMAFFDEQIRTVLPVLGFDFLRDQGKASSEAGTSVQRSPRFTLTIAKHGIEASGEEVDGEFYVLAGSRARDHWSSSHHSYRALYEQLTEDSVLVADAEGRTHFARDQVFSSPSAAAAVVAGQPMNGRTSWRVAGTGQTYGQWQDEQVSGVTAT